VRYYATSRKVSGSIPDEVTEFFDLPNHSGFSMPGLTQALTEMSIRKSIWQELQRDLPVRLTSHNQTICLTDF
jgi:hypothetical protein